MRTLTQFRAINLVDTVLYLDDRRGAGDIGLAVHDRELAAFLTGDGKIQDIKLCEPVRVGGPVTHDTRVVMAVVVQNHTARRAWRDRVDHDAVQHRGRGHIARVVGDSGAEVMRTVRQLVRDHRVGAIIVIRDAGDRVRDVGRAVLQGHVATLLATRDGQLNHVVLGDVICRRVARRVAGRSQIDRRSDRRVSQIDVDAQTSRRGDVARDVGDGHAQVVRTLCQGRCLHRVDAIRGLRDGGIGRDIGTAIPDSKLAGRLSLYPEAEDAVLGQVVCVGRGQIAHDAVGGVVDQVDQ